jgi:hypothetical protein
VEINVNGLNNEAAFFRVPLQRFFISILKNKKIQKYMLFFVKFQIWGSVALVGGDRPPVARVVGDRTYQ